MPRRSSWSKCFAGIRAQPESVNAALRNDSIVRRYQQQRLQRCTVRIVFLPSENLGSVSRDSHLRGLSDHRSYWEYSPNGCHRRHHGMRENRNERTSIGAVSIHVPSRICAKQSAIAISRGKEQRHGHCHPSVSTQQTI